MQLPENLINSINKYLEGTATPEEAEQVNRWYSSFNDEEVVVKGISPDMKDQTDTRLRLRLQDLINQSYPQQAKVILFRRGWLTRVAAAAAIIFIISTGAYFFLHRTTDTPIVRKSEPIKADPGLLTNKVILILGDGSKISLTDAGKGEVIKQKGFRIIKAADDQLVYQLLNSSSNEIPSAHNTIETPQGAQVRLNFPDGSTVWLNASSSLQFPVDFSNNEYNTNLKGEAYFEVRPNKLRKFRVRSGMQMTEVLGTRFNIRAYPDELSIGTTLLEGSIRITDLRSNQSQLIKPGQQARLEKTLKVLDSEDEDAIVWTEGYFQFNNADIKTVMRELERWYGIRVRYEGVLTSQKFEGSIDKKLTLQQVLGILEKSEVRFKIKGKEVTVMP